MQDQNIKSKWINGRDVLLVSILATLSFLIENSIGLILIPLVSGIPLIGGTLSAIPDAMIVFLGAYLVPRKGAILLFASILLTLSTVTPSFGPPGIYKILIGVALGMIFETLLLLSRRTIMYIGATAIVFAASIPVTYLAWSFFQLPGLQYLKPRIPFLMGVYCVEGAIGAALGYLLYAKRLSKLGTIDRIRTGRQAS